MNGDPMTSTYESPRLRTLGSVHELTQGKLTGNTPDGVLVLVKNVVNGS